MTNLTYKSSANDLVSRVSCLTNVKKRLFQSETFIYLSNTNTNYKLNKENAKTISKFY